MAPQVMNKNTIQKKLIIIRYQFGLIEDTAQEPKRTLLMLHCHFWLLPLLYMCEQ